MCVIKFLGRCSCILRWLRRRVGERLGELRALLGKLLTCRPKSVLGELFRRLAGAERSSRFSHLEPLRRVHPRRCTGAGGPCTICGTTSHATKYHIEFERYIAVRKPRPPTEPEGEDIEAMMRGVGLSDPPQPEGRILPPGPRGPPGHL